MFPGFLLLKSWSTDQQPQPHWEFVRSEESEAPLRIGESEPAFYQDPGEIHMCSRQGFLVARSEEGWQTFLNGGQKGTMFLLCGTDSHCCIYFTLSLLLDSHRQCGNKWVELCFNKIYFPKQVRLELPFKPKLAGGVYTRVESQILRDTCPQPGYCQSVPHPHSGISNL